MKIILIAFLTIIVSCAPTAKSPMLGSTSIYHFSYEHFHDADIEVFHQYYPLDKYKEVESFTVSYIANMHNHDSDKTVPENYILINRGNSVNTIIENKKYCKSKIDSICIDYLKGIKADGILNLKYSVQESEYGKLTASGLIKSTEYNYSGILLRKK
ncbi:MAG: hypothetical protein H0V01_14615 [Bacteroidetes bacterium]|nr:hypothetical protein [Bacteroidota bacterium]HET6242918.1 hypothetical protein [Bacteroidia bacterium]